MQGVEQRWAEIKKVLVGAQTVGIGIKRGKRKFEKTGGWDPRVETQNKLKEEPMKPGKS